MEPIGKITNEQKDQAFYTHIQQKLFFSPNKQMIPPTFSFFFIKQTFKENTNSSPMFSIIQETSGKNYRKNHGFPKFDAKQCFRYNI